MNKKTSRKNKLLLIISVYTLFAVVSFNGVISEALSNGNYAIENEEYIKPTINPLHIKPKIPRPSFFPLFYRIFNNDWNYWDKSPDMYSIATGNVGIGTTNPTEKLEVFGTIKMNGFIMPKGALDGYVLTSDATGVGTWKYFSALDGHSLDAHDGDPTNVVYINDDGGVVINTSGVIQRFDGANGTDMLLDWN